MLFMGCMAWLQMLSVLLNLVPVPPLDGFGIVSAYMDDRSRQRFLTPPLSYAGFFLLFILAKPLGLFEAFNHAVVRLLLLMGFDGADVYFFGTSFNQALFGHP
jgi:Zn-dependent protease